ncbi:MAG: ATP-binding protein [Candidatus Thermoplasmatota archaeon]|nr:ATP-binding protein [Candidatus Thermoplasmatota archaeon]
MASENIILNPNEPRHEFMVYKDKARSIILKTIEGTSEVFWILGKTGIGKTTMLQWLQAFGPLYKVEPIMVHGGENLTLDEVKTEVEQAISPSFFSRVFLRKKVIERPVLLLIDEAEYITDETVFEYLISKLDAPELRLSVVLASVDVVDAIVEKHLKGRDVEKIRLNMPPADQVLDMMKRRIESAGGEGYRPFGKQMVQDIVESSTTIRDVLIKLEEASR